MEKCRLWLSVFSHVRCLNLYYSRRTKVRFLSAALQQISHLDIPAQNLLLQKKCTKPPAQRRHDQRRQLCPRARALLVTWQEELLRFVFFLPTWHHAVQDFFSSRFSDHWKRSPRLLLQNTRLYQIASHCFVKTVFNAMTKHRVSY